jgi:murein DD-endopeptidase MepM/ murein hydrolase activator NlpD
LSKGIIHRIKPAKLDGLHAVLTIAVLVLLYLNIASKITVDSPNENDDATVISQTEKAEAEVVHSDRGDKAVFTVKSGDTLFNMLSEAGLSSQDSSNIAALISKHYPPSQLNLGQQLLITYKPDKITDDNITYYSVAEHVSLISDQAKIDVTYDDEKKSYKAEKIVMPVTKTKGFYRGQISESLYGDAIKAGVSPGMILEFIQRYSYIVDFQRDIQPGDEFELFYEYTLNESGKKLSDGPLLYGNLISGGKSKKLYRHTLSNGSVEYFNESGVSTKTTLLLTPINGAKISSKFGMRKHPILGYTKKHEGLDYAAPKGTPILSSGDGIIEEVKYASNGYGKHIKIRHTSKYQTLYAHMDRFAKTSKKGARVIQGDVIGYVGTTGNSTGPHLHYEVIELGKKINPSKVSFPKMPPLAGKELKKFNEQLAKLHEEIKQVQKS